MERSANSPETAPRTRTATRTRSRTRPRNATAFASGGSSHLEFAEEDEGGDDDDDDAVRALDEEMSPWGRGNDDDHLGRMGVGMGDRPADGIRRSPPNRSAKVGRGHGGAEGASAQMRRTYGGKGQAGHTQPSKSYSTLGRLQVQQKSGVNPSLRDAEAAYSAKVRSTRLYGPVRRLDMGAGGLVGVGRAPATQRTRASSAGQFSAGGRVQHTTVKSFVRAQPDAYVLAPSQLPHSLSPGRAL
ncbi:hypothetical protein T492DRAFT_849901 [Pavlovales sp. CCMP2436]|nr:hypothetical protein T492DRAFT_849901 [Pavlovales sp. CCMP2436]